MSCADSSQAWLYSAKNCSATRSRWSAHRKTWSSTGSWVTRPQRRPTCSVASSTESFRDVTRHAGPDIWAHSDWLLGLPWFCAIFLNNKLRLYCSLEHKQKKSEPTAWWKIPDCERIWSTGHSYSQKVSYLLVHWCWKLSLRRRYLNIFLKTNRGILFYSIW